MSSFSSVFKTIVLSSAAENGSARCRGACHVFSAAELLTSPWIFTATAIQIPGRFQRVLGHLRVKLPAYTASAATTVMPSLCLRTSTQSTKFDRLHPARLRHERPTGMLPEDWRRHRTPLDNVDRPTGYPRGRASGDKEQPSPGVTVGSPSSRAAAFGNGGPRSLLCRLHSRKPFLPAGAVSTRRLPGPVC
ncbi:hypothetical protein B0H17DRAFT_1135331 [Mycena rosella]|uniref:Uncharacterized protein n=1 Tax=Mycena rosella TaxID=1033263 RepID=A0AAD7DDJ4_MYCRO|nr:hypothetical protein B0H17DRAFT_1135331 [Mycena rosella]